MSILEITELTHSFGDRVLYRGAELHLYRGEHMGVVGQNGTGKSTLLGILTGQVVPDQGLVQRRPGLKMGHLDQYAHADRKMTIREYLQRAFAPLYLLERQVQEHYDQYARWGDERELKAASSGQQRLEREDFYGAETRLERVARGLGLHALGMERPLEKLSGGQRAKVILAELLLEEPDVLLLDEPTNFLDREHVEWLAEYLRGFSGAFVVVSHDFDFLEKITDCILDVEAETLRKYHGSYSEFLRQKEHLREDHLRRYTAQQAQIRRTEEYIRKNIAGVNSRNAKGRRKQLERLERVAPPTFALRPSFRFQESTPIHQRALEAADLVVGYGAPLLPQLSFAVENGEKLVITGFNGVGKSTLLKTLVGELPALSGRCRFSERAVLGYFEQELQWERGDMTPLQLLREDAPDLLEKQHRRRLADCGVREDHVRQPVETLSGGEQAKVKLCRLLLRPCNFLILDEPTNHLDRETKEVLGQALREFQGSVILVTHEEAFYRTWADRVMEIGK